MFISTFGVASAAEKSLPGEALYTIKVAIVEPLQGTLMVSAADKAQWENVLINRRLSEATTLAVQNKLATSTQEYLAKEVATHVALAQQDAIALSSSGDTTSASQVRTDLTEKLATNADTLSQLGPQLEQHNATSTVVAVAALLRVVNADITTLSLANGDTSAATTTTAMAAATPALTASTTVPTVIATSAILMTASTSTEANSSGAVMTTASIISLPDATSSEASTTQHTQFKKHIHK
jgi:hypothetical protein